MEPAPEAIDPAWIKDVFIFLGAAGIVVPLFHRARIGAVFGFLVVGVVVGPFGLGRVAQDFPWAAYLTISEPERVEPFAELGVIFLLFLLGLELSFERLWQLRRYLLGIGAVQVGLSAVVIGTVIFLTGAGDEVAIVLGLGLALSSTAIVMQLLREENRTATPIGRLAVSVLLFQDLMVVPILFVTGVLGGGAADGVLFPFLAAIVQAAVAVALIMFVGRRLVRPLLRFVAATGSRDLIMAVTVLIVVAAAGGTGAAGLSTALGAFLAGLLLGETEYRHQIEIDIDPFKGLLLGLFFVTVGMTIDLRVFAEYGLLMVAAVVALLAVKVAILFGAFRLFGLARGLSVEGALLLAQSGEFAFVVIALGRGNGLLDTPVAQFATAVVGITMILTPVLAVAARRLGALAPLEEGADGVPAEAGADDQVIVMGFGRVGQTVARILEAEGVSYLALDVDGALVGRKRKEGKPIFLGDGRRPEILERAGVAHARALVVTLADFEGTERVVATCARRWPQLPIFARARDREHGTRLAAIGAVVVPEVMEPSLQLAGRVLEKLGFSEDNVAQRLAHARDAELGRELADVAKPAAKRRHRAPRRRRKR